MTEEKLSAMEFDQWISCEKIAILQGGFLLSQKNYHPRLLCTLTKSDWQTVGQPIVQSVEEIIRSQNQDCSSGTQCWKKIVAVLWIKLLKSKVPDSSLDLDKRWKEDIFFSIDNILPAINYTLLFELLKSLWASELFIEFLFALPEETFYRALKKWVDHILSDTSTEDLKFFLDCWWELLRFRPNDNEEDHVIQLFSSEVLKCISEESSLQAPKRFKVDPDATQPHCAFLLLFDALKVMAGHISTFETRCMAMANILDSLYTAFLLDNSTVLPMDVYLKKIVKYVGILGFSKESHKIDKLTDIIKKAEKELSPSLKPSHLKPRNSSLSVFLNIFIELLKLWSLTSDAQYSMENCHPLTVFRLEEGILQVQEALGALSPSKKLLVCDVIQHLQEWHSVCQFPESASCLVSDVILHLVVTAIINNHLDRHKEACLMFSSKESWVLAGDEWITCLESNQDAFRDPFLILELASTLVKACSCNPMTDSFLQMKKLKSIIVSLFSELSLSQKNMLLREVFSKWGRKGLCGSLPGELTAGFGRELNLAFNCITQTETEHHFENAVSSVAMVAFQNPEATLQRACHLAVVNRGSHRLISLILKNLPCLIYAGDSLSESSCSFFVDCLLDTVWRKLSSSLEEEQFIDFIEAFLEPHHVTGNNGQEEVQSLPPADIVKAFVLPCLLDQSFNLELCLKILHIAMSQKNRQDDTITEHWILGCSPFPLLYSLCQLLDSCTSSWQENTVNFSTTKVSLEVKDLLINTLEMLCDVVGEIVESSPGTWSRSIFWLYDKVKSVDWSVRLRLKSVWKHHFKNEVPEVQFTVCNLPELEYAGIDIPEYGPGTGLLAWLECCCLSDIMRDHMLEYLVVNLKSAEEINMFSKGFMLVLVQAMPWCSPAEWKRLKHVVDKLMQDGILHVPYTLEYVEFMPMLNLRPFVYDLQHSMLLLRVFQLLCSSSCSNWLTHDGWQHVGRLYSASVRGILDSLKRKVPAPKNLDHHTDESLDLNKEVQFVLVQLFCHLLHVMVMMPQETYEPLYVASLEVLSEYESTAGNLSFLSRANTRQFLQSIAENLPIVEQRTTLLQKIDRF
ncbi:gem-associated protein 4 [Polypterus senegalus]